jgi:ABC-2 type transport system permease protein
MRLLAVEVRRLFARRFFWIGGLALIIGIGVVLAITGAQSEVPDAADRARAERMAAEQAPLVEQDRQRCQAAHDAQQRGEEDPSFGQYPPGYSCDEIRVPPAEDFLINDPFRFTSEMQDRTQVLTVVLALFAFLVGATAIGAEWHHGTLAALLLWEPRRIRVFLAKLLALFGGMVVLAVAGYAVNVAGHWAVAQARGVVGNVTLDFQRELALTTARGLAATLVAAAVGFALAFTLRRTAAALGVLIAYFGVFEIGARAFFAEKAEPFLLSRYVEAWLSKRAEIFSYDCGPFGDCSNQQIVLTLWQGAAYLGGLGLLAVVVAALVFRRREVA